MELSPKLYHWLVRPKWYTKLFLDSIIKGSIDFNSRLVLEFGCGIGSNSILFHPEYYIGVDCDEDRVRYAYDLYPGYRFKVLNTDYLPASDNTIDFILVVSVLHHIPSKELPLYLEEFRRVLKPGGQVIVYEPCFFDDCLISNLYMNYFDRGSYIRNKSRYLQI